MKTTRILMAACAALALAGAGYALYSIGMQRGMAMAPAPADAAGAAGLAVSGAAPAGASATAPTQRLPQGIAEGEEATRRHIASGVKSGDIDPVVGARVLYYHDPMVPGNKFDRPAKSPFMDMMLVPVYAGADGQDAGSVNVSPRMQQNLGVRSAEVLEAVLAPRVEAVGSILWNERNQVVVQTRAAGFVEQLHVRATLDTVSAGQPLADLYVPEWVAAQEEFLSLRRMQGSALAPLIDAARQRMRQAGMVEAQIALVERSETLQPRITLHAPIGGVVTELLVREGATVGAGAILLRINDTRTVWAQGEVPESQAHLLRPGAKVQARSPAAPGVVFTGRVQALLPEVDPMTRTVKARLELANPGGRLVPGMFVQLQFADLRATRTLVVPTEALIQTGTRSVVLLVQADGRFRAVDVVTGIEVDDQTQVLRGLEKGQRVVVSSQFLIDSEASLRGFVSRLNSEAPAPPATPATPIHTGQGLIDNIDKDVVTLTHGPIASMKWGKMTMQFRLPAGTGPDKARKGEQVEFDFTADGDVPVITALRKRPLPTPARPGAAASQGRAP